MTRIDQRRDMTPAWIRRIRMATTCGSATTASEMPRVITYICRPIEPYWLSLRSSRVSACASRM